MIRRLALAVAASVALFLGALARADAPRGAGGCGGDSDSAPACPPASLQCQPCSMGSSSCIEPLEQQGYTFDCRSGSVGYWCDSTVASRASSGFTIPLAGFLVAASVWSTVRIGRRRPKQQ